MFVDLSREVFNRVVVDRSSSSGVVELDRLNVIADTFGATLKVVLEYLDVWEGPRARSATQTALLYSFHMEQI